MINLVKSVTGNASLARFGAIASVGVAWQKAHLEMTHLESLCVVSGWVYRGVDSTSWDAAGFWGTVIFICKNFFYTTYGLTLSDLISPRILGCRIGVGIHAPTYDPRKISGLLRRLV